MKKENYLNQKRQQFNVSIRGEIRKKIMEQNRLKIQYKMNTIDQKVLLTHQFIHKVLLQYSLTHNKSILSVLAQFTESRDQDIFDLIKLYGIKILNIGLENIQQKEGKIIIGNLALFLELKQYLVKNSIIESILQKIIDYKKSNASNEVINDCFFILVNLCDKLNPQYLTNFDFLYDFVQKYFDHFKTIKNYIILVYQISKYIYKFEDVQFILNFIENCVFQYKQNKNYGYDLFYQLVHSNAFGKILPKFQKFWEVYRNMVLEENPIHIVQNGIQILKILIQKQPEFMMTYIIKNCYYYKILLRIEFSKIALRPIFLELLKIIIKYANPKQMQKIIKNQLTPATLVDTIMRAQDNSIVLLGLQIIEIFITQRQINKQNIDILSKQHNFSQYLEELCYNNNRQIFEKANKIQRILDMQSSNIQLQYKE